MAETGFLHSLFSCMATTVSSIRHKPEISCSCPYETQNQAAIKAMLGSAGSYAGSGLMLHVCCESTQACLHPMTHFHSSFWSPCALKSHQQKLRFWNHFYFSFNLQGRFSRIILYLGFLKWTQGLILEHTLKYNSSLMVLFSKALWPVWGFWVLFFGAENRCWRFSVHFPRTRSLQVLQIDVWVSGLLKIPERGCCPKELQVKPIWVH